METLDFPNSMFVGYVGAEEIPVRCLALSRESRFLRQMGFDQLHDFASDTLGLVQCLPCALQSC